MRFNRAGVVAMALALSACGSGATEPSPSTPSSSPPTATPTGAPAASSVAPASPSQMPSASLSHAPDPSAPVLGSLRIPFANREMEVTIVGEPGIVVAWRAASDRDLDAIAWGADTDIALGRLSERDLVLGWIGTVCDVKATLAIGPGRLFVTPMPRQGCDAMAVGRGMVLTFAKPAKPEEISVELAERVLLPEAS